MVRYIKNDENGIIDGQYMVPDDIGDKYRENGNENVSNYPWPDLVIYESLIADWGITINKSNIYSVDDHKFIPNPNIGE